MNEKENNDVNNEELTLNEKNSGELSLDDENSDELDEIKRMLGETFRDIACLLRNPFAEYDIFIYSLDTDSHLADWQERLVEGLKMCQGFFDWRAKNDKAILLRRQMDKDYENGGEILVGLHGTCFFCCYFSYSLAYDFIVASAISVFGQATPKGSVKIHFFNPKNKEDSLFTHNFDVPTTSIELNNYDSFYSKRLLDMAIKISRQHEEINRLHEALDLLQNEHEATQEELKQANIQKESYKDVLGDTLSNNSVKEKPLYLSEQKVKDVLIKLTQAVDEDNKKIFRDQDQWYAVYRVLTQQLGYTSDKSAFQTIMKDIGMENVDPPCNKESYRKINSDNLKSNPTLWSHNKFRMSEKELKQLRVAEKLIELLKEANELPEE